jgi:uncharacterized membrane protein
LLASICGPTCGLPLFVHVIGATVLFGGIATVAIVSWAAVRTTQQAPLLRRSALVAMLAVVWPAYVAMRVGAQWVLNHEGLDKSTPGWVDVGFLVSDVGIVLLLVVTFLAWLARRRGGATAWVAALSSAYLIALGVAWFAMSAKPGS